MIKFFLGSFFNKVKYEVLLEGLEVIIYWKSEILIDNEEFRFDVEYY